MSDWDDSDDDKVTSPPPKVAPAKAKGKWEGEDEDDGGPASDWEASSSEDESPKPAPSAAAAPPKKKGTLKAKLAEKEAMKAKKRDEDDPYDSDAVLDPREKARLAKEKELDADLNNATELFGAAAIGAKDLDALISFQPRTKDDFIKLSTMITELIIKRHQSKPLYPTFVEHHVRELAGPLKDVEVRKAASGLTTLANEKQKEQRDKASGKKKKAAKPTLGSAKVASKVDTGVYDEALDDFGNQPDDFM
ncbi:hypothetical protein GYMLUDRAFT_248882 [Collybiopsis luxurians FD-317 M1]|uniref:Eukaryotic translation initiation factor 3 subunit J n=1 Tax=Collybiopsis luxurians FD-317 M1 TaxID=944289 RepID=A0A0D0AWZ0_9AGAR|nr:hypothetical protein GYMLUDRAFT_248882 [Collybiopsis luxurians FD-317 M1]